MCAVGWDSHGQELTDTYVDNCMEEVGGSCDIDIDECLSSPCKNGATCADSTDDSEIGFHEYECFCSAGWEGFNCDVDIDECASNPCENGAACAESSSVGEVVTDAVCVIFGGECASQSAVDPDPSSACGQLGLLECAQPPVPINEFRQECRDFAEHWVKVQTDEFRRLGVEGL